MEDTMVSTKDILRKGLLKPEAPDMKTAGGVRKALAKKLRVPPTHLRSALKDGEKQGFVTKAKKLSDVTGKIQKMGFEPSKSKKVNPNVHSFSNKDGVNVHVSSDKGPSDVRVMVSKDDVSGVNK